MRSYAGKIIFIVNINNKQRQFYIFNVNDNALTDNLPDCNQHVFQIIITNCHAYEQQPHGEASFTFLHVVIQFYQRLIDQSAD